MHLRTKHKETQRMYLAVKKSMTPDYQMSEKQFEIKYNTYYKRFMELIEIEPG